MTERQATERQATERQATVLLHLASNLKRLRNDAGLSQETLAQRSGVSRRMLVSIESGDSNVSLSTLDKIAAALGALLPDLIAGPAASSPVLAWQGRDPASQAHLLQTAKASRIAELWQWSLAPGDSYPSAADPAGWYEMVFVIEGTLVIDFADGAKSLGPAASIAYRSDQPFTYRNAGDELVRFIRNVVI